MRTHKYISNPHAERPHIITRRKIMLLGDDPFGVVLAGESEQIQR